MASSSTWWLILAAVVVIAGIILLIYYGTRSARRQLAAHVDGVFLRCVGPYTMYPVYFVTGGRIVSVLEEDVRALGTDYAVVDCDEIFQYPSADSVAGIYEHKVFMCGQDMYYVRDGAHYIVIDEELRQRLMPYVVVSGQHGCYLRYFIKEGNRVATAYDVQHLLA